MSIGEGAAGSRFFRISHKVRSFCRYFFGGSPYSSSQNEPIHSLVKEKVCEEFFEKKCTIIFNKKRVGKSIRKCVRPKQKICDGNGPEECRKGVYSYFHRIYSKNFLGAWF